MALQSAITSCPPTARFHTHYPVGKVAMVFDRCRVLYDCFDVPELRCNQFIDGEDLCVVSCGDDGRYWGSITTHYPDFRNGAIQTAEKCSVLDKTRTDTDSRVVQFDPPSNECA